MVGIFGKGEFVGIVVLCVLVVFCVDIFVLVGDKNVFVIGNEEGGWIDFWVVVFCVDGCRLD